MKFDDNTIGQFNLPKHVLNSIALNNQRIREGSSIALVNPAYEGVDDDEIRSFVTGILSSEKLTPKLVEIEESNLSKLGPRSLAKPWSERQESLLEYFGKREMKSIEPSKLRSKPGRLVPASLETAASKLLRSSSSGLPYLQRKGNLLDERPLAEIADAFGVYPCMLYTRTQEEMKTRNVWGYPIADTLWEQQFHIPFLAYEKTLPFRKALLGPDLVDRAITDLFFMKEKDEVIHCVDFSAYDASISDDLVRIAFSIIASSFQERYHDELEELARRFQTIPILTPDGVISGPHGVPSGSSFTNTVDSLVQLFASGMDYENQCQIQGDDGVYLVRDRDVEKFNSDVNSFGLKLNIDKSDSFSSHEAIFLQRYYHPDYKARNGLGGVYSIARALNRIKYLERWTDLEREEIDGSDFFALRTIMILENCKHHPHFRDLVQFAHKHDKYSLTYSEAGLKAYSRMLESKVRAGVVNQFGDVGGIQNYEMVKVFVIL